MIDPANEILRDLVQSRIPALAGLSQIDFEPPNDEWRQAVVAAGEERLSCYLFDLRENLKLRSNQRTEQPQGSFTLVHRAPPRLDCQYLVTAWSPVSFSPPMVEPTRDEHVRLYEVLELLMRNRPLKPAEVYRPGVAIPSGRTLASVPAPLRQLALPLEVSPVADGLRNLGDFWNTMKVAWRPALQVTVTVPVVLLQDDLEVPQVTTIIGDYGQTAAAREQAITVGGRVMAGAASETVKGAWVQIQGLTPAEVLAVNQRTITNADGAFLFSRLPEGHYRLRVVASGLGDIQREVDLPSESGPYDVQFP